MHFSDLSLQLDAEIWEPRLELLDAHGEVQKMYDLTSLTQESIRLLLINSGFKPRDKLLELEEVDQEYEKVSLL